MLGFMARLFSRRIVSNEIARTLSLVRRHLLVDFGRLYLFRIAVIGTISILFVGGVFLCLHKKWNHVERRPIGRSLPLDVESVVKSFNFHHVWEGGEITIRGDNIVRRGRKFLAVRSSILKTNTFTNIKGSYTIRDKTVLTFQAADAEWDLSLAKPICLKKGVKVSINGRCYKDLGLVEIFFEKGTIELYGKKRLSIKI